MARRVKRMDEQADRFLVSRHLELSSRHAAKSRGDVSSKIRSLSTFQRYRQALGQAGKWAWKAYGIRRLDQLTPEMAKAYLDHRRDEGIGQKQLDNDRNAIQFVTGKLDRVMSDQKPDLASRAYSFDESARIAVRQSDRNGLATRIAHDAGLRAHELLTLQRADEAGPTRARQWRSDLFQGRTGVRYVVTGKGGLSREVMLSDGLSRALEARRLDEPRQVRDRGIHYEARYDIGGGQRWSKSFSKRSMTELGYSNGAHGLRHGYAQSRLHTLRERGLSDKDAKQIISQELGHFREQIVEVYLR